MTVEYAGRSKQPKHIRPGHAGICQTDDLNDLVLLCVSLRPPMQVRPRPKRQPANRLGFDFLEFLLEWDGVKFWERHWICTANWMVTSLMGTSEKPLLVAVGTAAILSTTSIP